MMKRMKNNDTSKETSITDLNESIIINILIFLPLQFIMRCRCVCKNWATLIAQPYFIQPYYTYHSSKRSDPSIQFLLHDETNKLFLAQLDEDSRIDAYPPPDSIIPRESQLYLKFLNDFYPVPSLVSLRICTTCIFTGFIVADAYDHHTNVRRGQYHIFNPITSQHFLVKQFITNEFFSHECALVFLQKTNQLKLLSFSVCKSDHYLRVDIQTIGTKLWRRIGSIPFRPEEIQFPTFANGLYHWIGYPRDQLICSFDAEKEVFKQIPTPAATRDYDCSNLGLLDGYLCIYMKSYSARPIELWVMNEYGIPESWTKKFVFHCKCDLHLDRILGPLKCLENGEVLVICRKLHAICYNPSQLHAICYNPSTGRCKYIEFDGKARYTSFPYIPSLRRVMDRDIDCERRNRRKKTRYLQL